MFDQLKYILKNLVSRNRLKELFGQLKEEAVRQDSKLYNDFILQEAAWNTLESQKIKGLLTDEAYNLEKRKIDYALLRLIGEMEGKDLAKKLASRLEEHHSIALDFYATCDRIPQNDTFQLTYYDPPEQVLQKSGGKIRFFYLHGDLRQEHASLFHRLGKQLSGLMLHFEEGDYDPRQEPVFVHCKPQASRHAKIFQIQTIKELMSQFVLRPEPVLKKTIKDLLTSELLAGKTGEDFVFVLLTIDDHNWDSEITPALIRSFYESFCDCELEEDAPSFFFFFGMEYGKDKAETQQQVEKAIEQAIYGDGLPRLEPVKITDVAEWISRIKPVLPPGTDPMKIAEQWFPDQKTIDMADVNLKLKQFIDQHNSGLVLGNE